MSPLKWDHIVSESQVSFLDIHVCAQRTSGNVSFSTAMYRKPNFRPHYLPMLSMHPAGHKAGIFNCELHRSLLLCSSSAAFESCVDDILRFLEDSGYPKRCFVRQVFDPVKRLALLDKIWSRQRGIEDGPVNVSPGSPDFNITAEHRRNVFFSFPFFHTSP